MKPFLLISLFLASCSSYVPIKYRVPSGHDAPQGTEIKISFAKDSKIEVAEQKIFQTTLQDEIIKDGWWKYVSTGKEAKEIIVADLTSEVKFERADIEVESQKRIRKASFQAHGTSQIELKEPGKKINKHFEIMASAQASSKTVLGDAPDMNKLLPAIGALLGVNEQQESINTQDSNLSSEAGQNLRQNLAREILAKITPKVKYASMKLDDEDDDMDPVVDFVYDQDFISAQKYLTDLLQEKNRGDALYNLAVIQEAQGNYKDNCGLYEAAYKIGKKKMYLKGKASCETRLKHRSSLTYSEGTSEGHSF